MASRPVRGFEGRGTIAGTFYRFSEVRITPTSEDLDITNSEGEYGDTGVFAAFPVPAIYDITPGQYQGSVDGPAICEVMIRQATLDLQAAPWGAPFAIREGHRIGPVVIFPLSDGLEAPFYFSCLQVRELPLNIVTRGLQEISFTSRTVGRYWFPGEGGNPGG